MLKILLGVAGVVFIGLGLFGGNVLEGFVGGDRGKPMVQLPSSNSTAISGTSGNTSAQELTGLAVAGLDSQATTEAVEVPAVSTVSQEQQMNTTSDAVLSVSADSSVEVVIDDSAADDNAADDGAEPIAPAQAAGDLIAMAEQAKSSSRNEQVDIANTLLSSNTTPVVVKTAAGANIETESQTVDKSTEVDSVVVTTTGDVDADSLIVVKDRVNLRSGPSISHPVVLTLNIGQELMEFKREGRWVHVGAFGTSGKIGWVHQRLVGPAK